MCMLRGSRGPRLSGVQPRKGDPMTKHGHRESPAPAPRRRLRLVVASVCLLLGLIPAWVALPTTTSADEHTQGGWTTSGVAASTVARGDTVALTAVVASRS